ncbi:50S ribosomal protein L19, partial [Candidatus Babeliales bacterium]|nr:50S ribosomal protein L19 [Candidatus Babeliales bacterium]
MKASKFTKETILDIGTTDRGFPKFNVGDTIEVSQFVKEGEKERIQKFTGAVIGMHTKGIGSTFTVRKIGAGSIGVERIFPYYSPVISSIKLVQQGRVR